MRVCDFLSVINSNLGFILYRFGNTVAYWAKNRQNRHFVDRTNPIINRPRSG